MAPFTKLQEQYLNNMIHHAVANALTVLLEGQKLNAAQAHDDDRYAIVAGNEYSVDDVATFCKVTSATVRDWCKKGFVKAWRPGSKNWRIDGTSIINLKRAQLQS